MLLDLSWINGFGRCYTLNMPDLEGAPTMFDIMKKKEPNREPRAGSIQNKDAVPWFCAGFPVLASIETEILTQVFWFGGRLLLKLTSIYSISNFSGWGIVEKRRCLLVFRPWNLILFM